MLEISEIFKYLVQLYESSASGSKNLSRPLTTDASWNIKLNTFNIMQIFINCRCIISPYFSFEPIKLYFVYNSSCSATGSAKKSTALLTIFLIKLEKNMKIIQALIIMTLSHFGPFKYFGWYLKFIRAKFYQHIMQYVKFYTVHKIDNQTPISW